MRMYFRTFCDFAKSRDIPAASAMNGGLSRYNIKTPGTAIIHSETENYNLRCGSFGDKYHACVLSKEADWQSFMRTAIEFMDEYEDMGCFTFYDECPGVRTPAIAGSSVPPDEKDTSEVRYNYILTDKARLNAYRGYDCTFYIIFNARPRLGASEKTSVIIGKDVYSFRYEKGSIIVWDIDRYENFSIEGKHTFWGIRQNTGAKLSVTDDVMVGLRNGRLMYAGR